MEEIENENLKRSKERSPSPGVKSTAVVKYTAFQSPVSYARLQCNTDLNLPPSNYGAAVDSYGLKEILTGETGLSSFRMAHMFPDCVGEVDVIAGAECIKKLLKLPYQPNGTISMMVHRVENTLLLDDFDVYDYLMKSEWSWLKDFFYENVLKTMSEQEKMSLALSPASPSALQLTRMFLSHSVPQQPRREPRGDAPACITGPFLPEPETRAEEPADAEHLYNRNVHWTFEDIHMLIGSDLPIFGDKDRPCVSLRLRDAREPINVLTGIDYWLDNLMCNVPEVLMCYHIDGIVQKYEPMKTEDLPNMENSKFSPKVIRNVAQNILSFLKSNATKAGHTYWLFKGPNDDVVKLYDLTSLCPDSMDNPFTTPVAMLLYRVARNMRLTNRSRHVRQLLEHVISLLQVSRYPQIVASSHYMLADLYIPATTNPASPEFKDESSDSDGEDYDFDDFDKRNLDEDDVDKDGDAGAKENEKESESEEKNYEKALAVQIRGLAMRDIGDRMRDKTSEKQKANTGKGLGVSPLDRCGRALSHALKGLIALHNVTFDKCKEEERERLKQQIIIEELHPKMANPCEPIKMDYVPLATKEDPKEHTSRSRRRRRKSERANDKEIEKREDMSNETETSLVESNVDKNAILIRKDNLHPSLQEPNRNDNFAWKLHLKTLLYEKICLAYVTLAEYSYANEQYGFSLKYIGLAGKCQMLLSHMIIKSKVVDASCLTGRVGDNYFQMSKNWHRLEQFRAQLETDHDIDASLRLEVDRDLREELDHLPSKEYHIEMSIPGSEVEAMLLSCASYRRALAAAGARRAELQRRLASVCNELAVRHMNDAQQIYLKYIEEDPKEPVAKQLHKQFLSISKKSLECLDEATEIFRSVSDQANLALLYCNKGRYLRFKAHCDQGGFTTEKRVLYKQAEELYLQALKTLGGDKEKCSIWHLVSWELSCHLYTRAVLMQEGDSGLYAQEVSEVADALKHALKYCPQGPGPRQYLYQFRAAMIYHRLGTLYHSQYRATREEGARRRATFAASRAHYRLAADSLAALAAPALYLSAQLDHVQLLDTQANLSPSLKLKSLQSALALLLAARSVLRLLRGRRTPEPEPGPLAHDDLDHRAIKSEQTLLSQFQNKLNFELRSITQYCRSKSNKDYERMGDMYKRMYCASLKIRADDDARLYAGSVCDVLAEIDDIYKEYE